MKERRKPFVPHPGEWNAVRISSGVLRNTCVSWQFLIESFDEHLWHLSLSTDRTDASTVPNIEPVQICAGNKYTLKGLLAFTNASRITFGTDFLFGNSSLLDASTRGLDAFFGAGVNNACNCAEGSNTVTGTDASSGSRCAGACLGAGGMGPSKINGCIDESAAMSALAAINRGNAAALLPRLATVAAAKNSTKL